MEPAVMTDCPSVIRLLYSYLDHEVDPAGRDMVDAHLVRCFQCRERYSAESQFLALLKSHLAPPKVSPSCGSRIEVEVQLQLPLTDPETTK
jgi:predicted anti-sigma-YlaC factor YlaD